MGGYREVWLGYHNRGVIDAEVSSNASDSCSVEVYVTDGSGRRVDLYKGTINLSGGSWSGTIQLTDVTNRIGSVFRPGEGEYIMAYLYLRASCGSTSGYDNAQLGIVRKPDFKIVPQAYIKPYNMFVDDSDGDGVIEVGEVDPSQVYPAFTLKSLSGTVYTYRGTATMTCDEVSETYNVQFTGTTVFTGVFSRPVGSYGIHNCSVSASASISDTYGNTLKIQKTASFTIVVRSVALNLNVVSIEVR